MSDPSAQPDSASDVAAKCAASERSTNRPHWGWLESIVAVSLFISFALLYLRLSHDYVTMPGFADRNNIFFGADQVDAQAGWVDNHKGIHPLMLLFVVPVTQLFGTILGSYHLGLQCFAAAIGALQIVLVFGFIRMLTRQVAPAAAVAAFFGVSMSQLVYSGLADTYVLAAVSNMPTWFLTLWCLRNRKAPFAWWLAAGLLSFAVTLTMLVNTVVCYGIVLLSLQSFRRAAGRAAGMVAVILVVGAALSISQRGLMPNAKLFWESDNYSHEMQYTSPLIVDNPALACSELAKNFTLYAFVAPEPRAEKFIPDRQLRLVYFKTPMRYGWPGMIAAVLWILLTIRGVIIAARDRKLRLLTLCLGLAVAANLSLHSFYNTREIFLCTPHFAFLIVLLGVSSRGNSSQLVNLSWCALAALTAFNNLSVHQQTVQRYSTRCAPVVSQSLVHAHDVWKVCPGKSTLSQNWNRPEFDDSAWQRARSGFGYGDGDDVTTVEMQDRFSTFYIRRQFHVDDLSVVSELQLETRFDDGFAVWINGVRVAEQNAPEDITHNSLATAEHEAGLPWRCFVSPTVLKPGRNTIAVVGLNHALNSSDLTLEVSLSAIVR